MSDDEQFNLPEGPRALFAGDALTRALAADLLAGNGPFKPDPLWASPFLVEAFADDYPIVRFFAANGLTRPEVPWRATTPDYLAPATARNLLLKQWRELIFPCTSEARRQARLLAAKLTACRRNIDLEVGE